MRNNCLASLLAFLLVIFLSLFILTAQLKALISPNFINGFFKKSKIIEELPAMADKMMAADATSETFNLNSAVLTQVVARSIKPDLWAVNGEQQINNFFKFLSGQSRELNLSFDFRSFKENFIREWATNAPALYRAGYDKLRACEPGEAAVKTEAETPVINCKSADVSAATLEESARKADLSEFVRAIPDDFRLDSSQNLPVFEKMRLSYNVLNLIFWISLVASLLLVASFIGLGWPNFRSITGWLGWLFVVVSGPGLALATIAQTFINFFLKNLSSQAADEASQILAALSGTLARSINQATLIIPLAIFILGVILIILSFTLPKSKVEPKPKINNN